MGCFHVASRRYSTRGIAPTMRGNPSEVGMNESAPDGWPSPSASPRQNMRTRPAIGAGQGGNCARGEIFAGAGIPMPRILHAARGWLRVPPAEDPGRTPGQHISGGEPPPGDSPRKPPPYPPGRGVNPRTGCVKNYCPRCGGQSGGSGEGFPTSPASGRGKPIGYPLFSPGQHIFYVAENRGRMIVNENL